MVRTQVQLTAASARSGSCDGLLEMGEAWENQPPGLRPGLWVLHLSCPIGKLGNPARWSLGTPLLGLGPDMAHLRPCTATPVKTHVGK